MYIAPLHEPRFARSVLLDPGAGRLVSLLRAVDSRNPKIVGSRPTPATVWR